MSPRQQVPRLAIHRRVSPEMREEWEAIGENTEYAGLIRLGVGIETVERGTHGRGTCS